MTREDVVSGMPFIYRGKVYSATVTDAPSGYLSTKEAWSTHACNCEFGPNAILWYSFVMGRRISGRIRYERIDPYIKPRPADVVELERPSDLVELERG